jgi:hypothetical protein
VNERERLRLGFWFRFRERGVNREIGHGATGDSRRRGGSSSWIRPWGMVGRQAMREDGAEVTEDGE